MILSLSGADESQDLYVELLCEVAGCEVEMRMADQANVNVHENVDKFSHTYVRHYIFFSTGFSLVVNSTEDTTLSHKVMHYYQVTNTSSNRIYCNTK